MLHVLVLNPTGSIGQMLEVEHKSPKYEIREVNECCQNEIPYSPYIRSPSSGVGDRTSKHNVRGRHEANVQMQFLRGSCNHLSDIYHLSI